MVDPDKRYILIHNEITGPYSLNELMAMSERREINNNTLFWSERESKWHLLSGVLFDYHPTTIRIEAMIEAGIEYVKVLGSSEDCSVCKSLQGVVYSIRRLPVLPPLNCCCNPWCKSLFMATI